MRQVFYLIAAEEHRATIERVLGFYADSCPIVRSIKESIEISSELEFTPAQKSSEKLLKITQMGDAPRSRGWQHPSWSLGSSAEGGRC